MEEYSGKMTLVMPATYYRVYILAALIEEEKKHTFQDNKSPLFRGLESLCAIGPGTPTADRKESRGDLSKLSYIFL